MSIRLALSSANSASQATPFHFVRDYEVSKVEQEVTNEYLFVIDEGDGEVVTQEGDEMKPTLPRAKGAYYKNILRKMVLKKKRVNVRVSTSSMSVNPL